MPEHTCPHCLSPVSPRVTECPYCRGRLTPPASALATPAPARVKPPAAQTSRSELGFLRRHMDGRAMCLPLGFRFLAFEIPEARAPRIVGAQKDLTVLGMIVAGGIAVVRPYDLLFNGLLIAVLGLILTLWLPRGCRRVRLSRGDLVPLDLSPAARAREAGKPLLRRRGRSGEFGSRASDARPEIVDGVLRWGVGEIPLLGLPLIQLLG